MVYELSPQKLLVLRNCLSWEELSALQRECDRSVAAARLSPDELCSRACAIDLFEDSVLADDSEVRTDRCAYLAERWRSSEITPEDRSIIDDVIFSKLPSFLRASLGLGESYLFNEHYIVKPPQSDMEFGWHVDEEKQLGCLSPLEQYVTIWCPLDATTAENGTLSVKGSVYLTEATVTSGQCNISTKRQKRLAVPDQDTETEHAITAAPGDLVVFSSQLLHCSGPNHSVTPRRVFYVQYSPVPIGGNTYPLSFAVKTNTILEESASIHHAKRKQKE